MSLTNLLFGDFEVVYSTDLPLHEAVGRLAAMTDQTTPLERRGISTMQGYATTHEVVLSQEAPYLLAPFHPVFIGHFVHEHGETQLRGRICANSWIKIWLSAPLVMTLVLGTVLLFGGTVHTTSSATSALGAGLIIAAVFALLRLVVRPGSMLVRPLGQAISLAIAGHGPNNSFKPKPLRGSA